MQILSFRSFSLQSQGTGPVKEMSPHGIPALPCAFEACQRLKKCWISIVTRSQTLHQSFEVANLIPQDLQGRTRVHSNDWELGLQFGEAKWTLAVWPTAHIRTSASGTRAPYHSLSMKRCWGWTFYLSLFDSHRVDSTWTSLSDLRMLSDAVALLPKAQDSDKVSPQPYPIKAPVQVPWWPATSVDWLTSLVNNALHSLH